MEKKEAICSRIGPTLDAIFREYTRLSQEYDDLSKVVYEDEAAENLAKLEALEARLQPWIPVLQRDTES